MLGVGTAIPATLIVIPALFGCIQSQRLKADPLSFYEQAKESKNKC
jgi:hypothetical protein